MIIKLFHLLMYFISSSSAWFDFKLIYFPISKLEELTLLMKVDNTLVLLLLVRPANKDSQCCYNYWSHFIQNLSSIDNLKVFSLSWVIASSDKWEWYSDSVGNGNYCITHSKFFNHLIVCLLQQCAQMVSLHGHSLTSSLEFTQEMLSKVAMGRRLRRNRRD